MTGQTEFSKNCMYKVQEKAWIDERVFLIWIEKVWKPFTREKQSSYLIIDECSVHMMSNCVREIQGCGVEIDFVIGGYTSKLQVLDVGVNKPFKGYIRECYKKFMMGNTNGIKATRLDVAKWVDEAWHKVTPETVSHTWQCIGFEFFL